MSHADSIPALGTLAFGASWIGADPARRERDEDAVRAMLRSVDSFLDTSNNYAGGRSEAIIGDVLATLSPTERADAAARLITKVDADPVTGVFDGDRVRRSVEESLTRLGIDRVPVLHLHDPYTITFAQATAADGAVAALVALRDEGVAGAIGIAAGPVPLVQAYVETGAFDAVLVHNRFTLVDDSAASLFAQARERGLRVFNAAVFGGGLLATGPTAGASYQYRPADADLLAWTRDVQQLCATHGVPLAAIALQFSTRSPLVDHTVIGTTSAHRLAEVRELAEVDIPAELVAALASMGPAPTPVDDAAYRTGQSGAA
ncbi:aldo/keto reductase [Microbacterium sp. ZW T5_56]|uniref:aldo/keto reductase n=1 Tax=Microbacterium sp. ZW T5_56 TaxID=3378081 RepID=UPI0038533394